MNKKSVSKNFNNATPGEWTTIIDEKIKLTNAFFTHSPESEAEINVHVDKYLQMFLSKAVQRKIIGLKVLVNWPVGDVPLRPVVTKVEVFKVTGTKYILLMHIGHLPE